MSSRIESALWTGVAVLLLAESIVVGAQPKQPTLGPKALQSTRDFARYVGTYPCTNGLLKQQVLLSSLRKVLGSDYEAYRGHVRASGCGAIEKKDGFLLLDVSQQHVGGFTSLLFIDLSDGSVYLFWLKSTVADRQWSFYGKRPIPPAVSQIVESEMNTGWGHVARFTVKGDAVEIRVKDKQ